MDERILDFIEKLKSQLECIPQKEIDEAVGYYEEYLCDAAEAGKDLDIILMQLDPPERIAGMIKTETSIIRAQHSPGLRNFTSVLKNAFMGVTTPFAVLLLSIFIIVSYSMVITLFAGAFTVFIGAVVIVLGMFYEAFTIPFHFTLEIAGTLGIGLMGAGICLLAAFGLYKLGRLFIRISTRLVRRMVKRPGKPIPEMNEGKAGKKPNSRRVALVLAILSIAGLILFSVSGLPVRFFIIFNSMKPENVVPKTMEFNPAEINKISVITAHSHIKLIRNSSDKIMVSYEQPDWLDYEVESDGSMLSFYEKSNGRLPLFDLVKLHESRTELVVSIPEEYSPEVISVESTGGFVYVTGLAENIQAKTYTGSIFLEAGNAAGKFNTKANTKTGSISVNGFEAGHRINGGLEYYSSIKAGKTIELRSSRGNINIE